MGLRPAGEGTGRLAGGAGGVGLARAVGRGKGEEPLRVTEGCDCCWGREGAVGGGGGGGAARVWDGGGGGADSSR